MVAACCFYWHKMPPHFSVANVCGVFVSPQAQHKCELAAMHKRHISQPTNSSPSRNASPYITLCRNNKCELRFRKQHLFCNLDVYFSLSNVRLKIVLVFHILQSFRINFSRFFVWQYECSWQAALIEFGIIANCYGKCKLVAILRLVFSKRIRELP